MCIVYTINTHDTHDTQHTQVFFFLLESDASLLISVPSFIGILIQIWKVRKATGFAFTFNTYGVPLGWELRRWKAKTESVCDDSGVDSVDSVDNGDNDGAGSGGDSVKEKKKKVEEKKVEEEKKEEQTGGQGAGKSMEDVLTEVPLCTLLWQF